jgi:hypothetical protein
VEVQRLEGVTSLDELERHVQVAWRAQRAGDAGANGTEWMIRVVLSGPCPLWPELRTEEDRALLSRELREILGGLDVVVVADDVHPAIAVEEHRLRPDVLGEILRLSDSVRRGDAKLGIERSDLVGLTSEDPAVLEAYVRSLLSGADGELASRVLEEPTKS